MSKNAPAGQRFVVCIRNDDYEMDLALHKIYAVLPDPSAEGTGTIRIVDEKRVKTTFIRRRSSSRSRCRRHSEKTCSGRPERP